MLAANPRVIHRYYQEIAQQQDCLSMEPRVTLFRSAVWRGTLLPGIGVKWHHHLSHTFTMERKHPFLISCSFKYRIRFNKYTTKRRRSSQESLVDRKFAYYDMSDRFRVLLDNQLQDR